MPNHCHNRVTFYAHHSDGDESSNQIAKIKKIFEDEECFTQIIPEPDWLNAPLMSKDVQKYSWDKPLGKVGELPQYVDTAYGKSLRFKSTDKQDDRWYDWRVQNWDTKWDAYGVTVTDDDPENLEVEFNTAWAHPKLYVMNSESNILTYPSRGSTTSPAVRLAGYL